MGGRHFIFLYLTTETDIADRNEPQKLRVHCSVSRVFYGHIVMIPSECGVCDIHV